MWPPKQGDYVKVNEWEAIVEEVVTHFDSPHTRGSLIKLRNPLYVLRLVSKPIGWKRHQTIQVHMDPVNPKRIYKLFESEFEPHPSYTTARLLKKINKKNMKEKSKQIIRTTGILQEVAQISVNSIADHMNKKQPEISRLRYREDMQISKWLEYLRAISVVSGRKTTIKIECSETGEITIAHRLEEQK